jgi:mevalonate kinase
MSSYIAASNQEMLWRTILKNALFCQILTPEQQPIWFREIIGVFYSETTNKNLSNNSLLELNKNTIRYMVRKLKEQTSQPAISVPINDRLQPQSSSYQSDYDKLQTNYNDMHQRNVPREPDFKEPIDDEKITNMDELLQQQSKDRALETQKPPFKFMSDTINQVQHQSETTNVKTEINEISTQTINNDISELMNLYTTLLQRTDVMERELNNMRSQLIHQPNNDENLTLQLQEPA